MPELSDIFYLGRAGRYSRPLNSNARLPVVYGDLTDGSNGVWELPCIDDDGGGMNPVYCFAAHEVLSAANGNSITIYEEGMELNPALYTFDESNDYESEGVIATITFTSPKANAVITARGMGKPTASGGATLMENIIDQVYDFLTVENAFASSLFESTYKAKASQIFTAQGYSAAGVINEDTVIWDIITEMMGAFLGSAYLDGSGELVLEIDDGSLKQYSMAAIVSRGDANLVDAKQRLANIINQCPANYAYNYAAGEFKSHDGGSTTADLVSQGVHGVREPNTPCQHYWCRDQASIRTIQGVVVEKFKNPLYEIEIQSFGQKLIHVDRGDVVVFSAEDLYGPAGEQLFNHYWRVLSVKHNDDKQGTINVRALQTNYFMTVAHLADGTHIADGRVLAGGERDLTIY